MSMELFQAHDHYIVQDGEHSLWCSRFDGKLTPKAGSDLCTAWNPVCLGQIFGVVGKIQIHPDSDWKLLLVRQRKQVGKLPNGVPIYCITKIAILPLSLVEPTEFDIELCKKHHFGISKPQKLAMPADSQQKVLMKTWNSIVAVTTNKKRESKDREKVEKRILEELQKMFMDSDSFYYSPGGDLTNCVQRSGGGQLPHLNLDERFFWNRHMLKDLIQAESADLARHWLVPIIQGYVQMEECRLEFPEDRPSSKDVKLPTCFTITLISRRSHRRAGVRYKRRGVDETGAVANYVETEQIIQIPGHTVSFVQVRGSVPVYWTQSGYKYKPVPRLHKDEEETLSAFEKHFAEQLAIYQKQTIVNLIDQSGKEQIVGNSYLRYILKYNSPHLTYVTFDFHDYCKGMKFENVAVLTERISDIIKDMRYCWVDRKGVICEQRGVFRVNCIDCLDRTNIVQTALARVVLDIQLRKLGLVFPDQDLPPLVRTMYQQMWANNGDVISRQYAGTVALKGDFTRTGERKISGMMKDGYHSANRYIQKFKDAYRQACIDIMLGNSVSEELAMLTATRSPENEDLDWLANRIDGASQLIDHCKVLILPEEEDCFGAWVLIDCDSSFTSADSEPFDSVIVLMITNKSCYIARYDEEDEKVLSDYEKIAITNLVLVEMGLINFRRSGRPRKCYCLRVHYTWEGEEGYFHTFATMVELTQKESVKDIWLNITQTLATARAANSLGLKINERDLNRARSQLSPQFETIPIHATVSTWFRKNLLLDNNEVRRERERESPASTSGEEKAKEYFQNFKTKFSNLNPIKKLKIKKRSSITSSRETEATGGDQLQQEGEPSADVDVDSSVSPEYNDDSSSTEDGDELLSSYSGGDKETEAEEEEDEKESGGDSELLLKSCGILATNPSRNRLSLSLRNVKSISEDDDDLTSSDPELSKRLEKLGVGEVARSPKLGGVAEAARSPKLGRRRVKVLPPDDLLSPSQLSPGGSPKRDREPAEEKTGAPSALFTLGSEPLDTHGGGTLPEETDGATRRPGADVAEEEEDFSHSLGPADSVGEEISISVREDTGEISVVRVDRAADDEEAVLEEAPQPSPAQSAGGGVGSKKGKSQRLLTPPQIVLESQHLSDGDEGDELQMSPVTKSHSENNLVDYVKKLTTSFDRMVENLDNKKRDLKGGGGGGLSASANSSPLKQIRDHFTSIPINLKTSSSSKVQNMVTLHAEMNQHALNCQTRIIQL